MYITVDHEQIQTYQVFLLLYGDLFKVFVLCIKFMLLFYCTFIKYVDFQFSFNNFFFATRKLVERANKQTYIYINLYLIKWGVVHHQHFRTLSSGIKCSNSKQTHLPSKTHKVKKIEIQFVL